MFDSIEPETVYLVLKNVNAMCGNQEHLQMFKRHATEEGSFYTTYYQTFGGGPEGGYWVREFYNTDGSDPRQEVYSVERSWGEPFKVKRLDGRSLHYESTIPGNAYGSVYVFRDEECPECEMYHNGPLYRSSDTADKYICEGCWEHTEGVAIETEED